MRTKWNTFDLEVASSECEDGMAWRLQRSAAIQDAQRRVNARVKAERERYKVPSNPLPNTLEIHELGGTEGTIAW